MTPCEELGYRVGDLFQVALTDVFCKGSIIRLVNDDFTPVPWFELIKGARADSIVPEGDPFGYACLDDIKPAPAKVKLAYLLTGSLE